MATVVEIRNLVLKKLKRFPISGIVNASLSADVDDAIQAKQDQLAGGDDPIAYWGASITDMPNEAKRAFVGLVAASLAEELAVTPTRMQLLLQRANGQRAVIADLSRVAQDDLPEKAVYY